MLPVKGVERVAQLDVRIDPSKRFTPIGPFLALMESIGKRASADAVQVIEIDHRRMPAIDRIASESEAAGQHQSSAMIDQVR